MEGQEEWLEPTGEALVVVAKMFLVGASIAFVWGAYVRLAGHQAQPTWPLPQTIAAFVFSSLSFAFWLAGKLSILLGRKMRERGLKLP
jgi:heme/copper-type cytochrome/quinol oxidase subunit 1